MTTAVFLPLVSRTPMRPLGPPSTEEAPPTPRQFLERKWETLREAARHAHRLLTLAVACGAREDQRELGFLLAVDLGDIDHADQLRRSHHDAVVGRQRAEHDRASHARVQQRRLQASNQAPLARLWTSTSVRSRSGCSLLRPPTP